MRTIVLAMHVAAMSARAWLEIHEFELACEWLTYSLERQQQRARRLLHNWLGQDRAYFFHNQLVMKTSNAISVLNDGFAGKKTFCAILFGRTMPTSGMTMRSRKFRTLRHLAGEIQF